MGSRRRAEQFAAAVDARTPADEVPEPLRELVDVVGAMRELDAPAPRPEFATQLREQLMAEAPTALAPASPLALPARRRGTRDRRLTAAAAVFTLVGGTAGMAAAAQDALPGEALYPIKRGIEDARLSVQTDDESRGRSYLDQASSRLDEADRLMAEEASSVAVADTVDSFVVQAVAGADLLLASFEDQRSPEDVQDLRQFAADALAQLQLLAETAPADIQDELARAAVVLQRIDQQAASTCNQCSDLPALEMPVLMAQAAEISRAMEAVRTEEPNNDHPTMAVTLPRGDRTASPDRQRSDEGGAGSGAGGEAPPSGEGTVVDVDGTGTKLPKDPEQALEGVDKATGGLLGEVSDDTEKTVEELESGLEDALGSTLEGDSGE